MLNLFEGFQLAQFLVMTAAAGLLWSVRHAFKGGQWATALADRVTAVEQALQHAREKQSEMESLTTTKIGSLELDLRELQTESRLRAAEWDRDRLRVDREIEDLKRRL